jgi:sterol desaturase/sphingolipid hydroxylase (fatty acid hydroxylase superfamily)
LNLVVLHGFLKSFESGLFNAVLDAGSFKTPWALEAPPIIEATLATFTTMISIDFASYAAHRIMHRWPVLWSFHAIHHSAEKLTPLTTYRQHPVELFFLNGARALAAGFGLTTLYAFFQREPSVVTVYGLGAGFFVYMFTVNLHHSMVPVSYPHWLRGVLVSPHVHHIHHSMAERHIDRNFGVVFSVWDRMFGTYCDEEIGLEELEFGLGASDPADHSALVLLVRPVKRWLPTAAAARFFLFILCGLVLFLLAPGTARLLASRFFSLFALA